MNDAKNSTTRQVQDLQFASMPKRQSGVALVIVLIIMALALLLAINLLRSERSTALQSREKVDKAFARQAAYLALEEVESGDLVDANGIASVTGIPRLPRAPGDSASQRPPRGNYVRGNCLGAANNDAVFPASDVSMTTASPGVQIFYDAGITVGGRPSCKQLRGPKAWAEYYMLINPDDNDNGVAITDPERVSNFINQAVAHCGNDNPRLPRYLIETAIGKPAHASSDYRVTVQGYACTDRADDAQPDFANAVILEVGYDS